MHAPRVPKTTRSCDEKGLDVHVIASSNGLKKSWWFTFVLLHTWQFIVHSHHCRRHSFTLSLHAENSPALSISLYRRLLFLCCHCYFFIHYCTLLCCQIQTKMIMIYDDVTQRTTSRGLTLFRISRGIGFPLLSQLFLLKRLLILYVVASFGP